MTKPSTGPRANQLRAAMLKAPELIDAIRLTAQQRAAVQHVQVIGGADVLTHDLAKRMNLRITQASNLLKACHDKGYLTRRQCNDPTGGHMWAYSFARGVG